MNQLLAMFESCALQGQPPGCITTQDMQDLICSIPTIAGVGTTQLTKDVLAGPGTGALPATVTGLQSRPLSAAPPIPGQVLGWNGATWLPTTPTGGGSSGVSGAMTITSACTGTGCTPITSCATFTNGALSSFAAGACGGGGGASLVARNAGGTVGRNGGGSVARN